VRDRDCLAFVFGIYCSVIDRQSRSRLARIAVIFRGGGSQNEHKAHYAQSGTCFTSAHSPSARRTGITPELIFLLFKEECLNRMIFVRQASLRRAMSEFVVHYHEERNHQGLDNTLIRADPVDAANKAFIHCRQRLGGMLNYYHRAAAGTSRPKILTLRAPQPVFLPLVTDHEAKPALLDKRFDLLAVVGRPPSQRGEMAAVPIYPASILARRLMTHPGTPFRLKSLFWN
jgi:hypothetical protein